MGVKTLPLRGGWGRVEPPKEKCVYYKLFLVTKLPLWYILSRMTNLIDLAARFLDCLILTLEVLAKIAFNFSPALLLILAFVGIKTLVTK